MASERKCAKNNHESNKPASKQTSSNNCPEQDYPKIDISIECIQIGIKCIFNTHSFNEVQGAAIGATFVETVIGGNNDMILKLASMNAVVECHTTMIQKFFETFGGVISALIVRADCFDKFDQDDVLHLINKYCVQLEMLTIEHLNVKQGTIDKLNTLIHSMGSVVSVVSFAPQLGDDRNCHELILERNKINLRRRIDCDHKNV